MQIGQISLPEVYTNSADFRFFIKWFETALQKICYDIENFYDLYDALRCPQPLLWLLADTMGFKYDDRLPTSFNRLVLLYFMSMIRNRGSKDGIMLAAETNLAQFRIMQEAGTGYINDDNEFVEPNPELFDRLDNTAIPVNSVYVTPHTAAGYIDVVYFSSEQPIDACIEYVRPLGMYLFQSAGVRFDTKTKITIDAKLTDINDMILSIGPTRVGHYSRHDYASMQQVNSDGVPIDDRELAWLRNKKFEGDPSVEAGYHALYSLQLCNNNQIVDSLMQFEQPIFSLGYNPQDADYKVDDRTTPYPDRIMDTIDGVAVKGPQRYLRKGYSSIDEKQNWNLRYDKILDEQLTHQKDGVYDTYTVDEATSAVDVKPDVNPVMSALGDAISLNPTNTKYTKVDEDGKIIVVDE